MAYRPQTLLIDMDDTIENLTAEWIRYANRRFGTAVDPSDVTTWDTSLAFPGISNRQIYDLLLEEELYEHVVPFPGAVHYIDRLIRDGHEVYIVTNSPYQVTRYKLDRILFRNFPFLDWDHVILTKKKQLIRGDILIDDAPHNLIGGSYEKILFTANHNRAFDAESHGMTRVGNWKEAYATVCTLSGKQPEDDTLKTL